MATENKYLKNVKPNLEKIKKERINGASMEDIANFVGVKRQTLYTWMKKYPEFKQVMDEAESALQFQIESTANHSLIDKLTDRLMVTEQIIVDGIVTREKKQLVKADTTAIIFALKARNPDKWDPLGVARIKEDEKQNDLNAEILEKLDAYKPKGENDNGKL